MMPDDDEPQFQFEAWARASDPDTSHRAAASIAGKAVNEAAKTVLVAVASTGLDGANWMEVSRLTGQLPQSISPRWKELVERGLIEKRVRFLSVIVDHAPKLVSQTITRPGWTGKEQIVWFATAAGEAYARTIRSR